MAVLDCEDNAYYPTDQIILSGRRKRFNVAIHSQHWQLRALTGLASDNVLCFPGGSTHKQIHTLNLDTRERLPVRKLSFVPRCLTAAQGWVCCGGEHGEFSAVKIGTPETLKDGNFEVPTPFVPSSETPVAVPKSARFVRERVNCVTMWFPVNQQPQVVRLEQHPGAYSEPVAVLSNNDKTVTLVSLNSFADARDAREPQPLCSLTYPDFVNRAVISPDGEFLAAVLDDPYLYIHQRTENEEWLPGNDDKERYDWHLCAKILLKSQYESDKTDRRGSFALTFSPSGQYLAAGTQHGVVSVFRVDKLATDSDNALLKTFNSSRAGDSNGAIRDMAFCPGKYGLLAWTEDRGRVGIADVGSNFNRRQIIKLKESSSFKLNPVLDGSEPLGSVRTFQQNTALLTRELQSSASELPSPPPAFDYRLTDYLRRTRARELERHIASPEGAAVVPFTHLRTPPRIDSVGHVNNPSSFTAPTSNSRSMLQSALLVSSLRISHSARNPTSTVTGETTHDPDSVPMIEDDPAFDGLATQSPRAFSGNSFYAGSWRQAGSSESQGMAEVRAHIQSLQQIHPAREIEQLFTPEVVRDMAEERDRRIATERRSSPHQEASVPPSDTGTPMTRRVVGAGSLYRDYVARRNNSFNALTGGRDNTSGMAWSSDGDALYVGSEDGIYEMHVNTTYWKTTPSVEFR